MSLSARDAHIFRLLIVFVLVTITFYYLFLRGRYDVHDVYRAAVAGRKQSFLDEFLSTDIDGPFDGSALADLCEPQTWIPGLIFKCEPPQGSLANVRNIILNCVRYAIEAGATGFIVPEIMVRRPKLISLNELHAQRIVPFTYLFDQAHFKSTLSSACPRIHIYDHPNDLWDVPSTGSPVHLTHPHLTSHFHTEAGSVLRSPVDWTNAFKDRLNTSHPRPFSASKPVLVSLHSPLLQWPIDYDHPAFIATFGRILRINEDLRRLAGTVLYAMNFHYHLDFDAAFPGIQAGKFYGAHLRTAVDAVRAGWTPYLYQSKNYISDAAANHFPLIYLTSDSPLDTLKFIDQAGNHSFPMEVTTKDLLLAGTGFGSERAEMAGLTSDQQDAVDYEVLLKASRVGGTWESSFSWNLAMRRHVVVGQGSWAPLDAGEPIVVPATESEPAPSEEDLPDKRDTSRIEVGAWGAQIPPLSFSDAHSTIFGDVLPGDHPGLVFQLALWP